MDEDEELYREMNEEDPYYMGNAEHDDIGQDEKTPVESPKSSSRPEVEHKPMKWWMILFGIVSWIMFIASIVLVCLVS